MARNGLILGQNDTAGFRKVFRYLPDLRDAISKTKKICKRPKIETCRRLHYFYIENIPRVSPRWVQDSPSGADCSS
jgi:hypothetical protein